MGIAHTNDSLVTVARGLPLETPGIEIPTKTYLLYVIEMTYTTIGVKLVVMARYGARFVVLKHPIF